MNTHIYKGAFGKSYIMETFMKDKQNQICGIIYENNNYPSFLSDVYIVKPSNFSIEELMTVIPFWMKEKEICLIYTNKSEEENQELIKSLKNLRLNYSRQTAIIMCSEN